MQAQGGGGDGEGWLSSPCEAPWGSMNVGKENKMNSHENAKGGGEGGEDSTLIEGLFSVDPLPWRLSSTASRWTFGHSMQLTPAGLSPVAQPMRWTLGLHFHFAQPMRWTLGPLFPVAQCNRLIRPDIKFSVHLVTRLNRKV